MVILEPEEEFVVLCSRLSLDDERKERLLELLKSPLRWKSIFDMAMKNKVMPLIFKHLNDGAFYPYVSETIREKLTQFYYGNLARNLVLFSELRKFLREFEEAGIPVLILKGGFISHVLYEDQALRLMSDIDLLIKREDMERIDEIAERLGYAFLKTKKSKELYEKYHFHYIYVKTDNLKLVFEFHWNLVKSSMKIDIKPEELWENTVEFDLFDLKVRSLSFENQFLHLIIHAAHDCFEHGLIALCEIAEFYKRFKGSIDIPKFVNISYRVGANKLVYYTLYHIERVLDFKFDDHLVWQFKPHPISAYFLEKGFDLRVILKGDVINNLGIVYLTRLFMHNNPIDSLNLLRRIFSPTEEYMMELFQVALEEADLFKRIKVFLLGMKLYYAMFKRGLKI